MAAQVVPLKHQRAALLLMPAQYSLIWGTKTLAVENRLFGKTLFEGE